MPGPAKSSDKKLKEKDILSIVDEVAEEINTILNERRTEKYFYGLMLLYSFVENLLKHMCFLDLLWKQAGLGEIHRDIVHVLQEVYLERLRFQNAIDKAAQKKLISKRYRARLHELRQNRNSVVHQCWLYRHRNNPAILRKELVDAARLANYIVRKLGKLADEMGTLDLYIPGKFA